MRRLLRAGYLNLVQKPKGILSLLSTPGQTRGATYHPDKRHRSARQIWLDQLRNVLSQGYTEPYYYLYGMDTMTRKEQKRYLLYRPFMEQRDRRNLSFRHNSSCLLRNKLYFGIMAKAMGFPTPENVAFVNGGAVLDLRNNRQTTLGEFVSSYSGQLFCKIIDGECGTGIFRLEVLPDHSVRINDEPSSLSDLQERFGNASFLLQESISQHPAMNRLYPNSINTLRIETVADPKTGVVGALPSVLRVGAHGNYVDNFSAGGLIVGVDLSSGHLTPRGYMKPSYGTLASQHPDTGVKFSDFTVPFIDQAVDMACRFHSLLGLHSIGWDVALTPDGPCFIEGNDNWEVELVQISGGGMREYFINKWK